MYPQLVLCMAASCSFLQRNSGCGQAFSTGCCGEVCVGFFSSRPALRKRLFLLHFPEQSDRNEGGGRGGWGEGNLGQWSPLPKECRTGQYTLYSIVVERYGFFFPSAGGGGASGRSSP
jgi:hypothetical protein